MLNLNNFEAAGFLLSDPKFIPGNDDKESVTYLKIATNKKFKDKNGDWIEKMKSVPVRFFGKKAETIANSFRKGSHIYVTAEVDEAKRAVDGETLYETVLIGKSFQFTERKSDNQHAD